jgi:hypothetical protein
VNLHVELCLRQDFGVSSVSDYARDLRSSSLRERLPSLSSSPWPSLPPSPARCRSWRASGARSTARRLRYHASSSLTAASRRASAPSVCPVPRGTSGRAARDQAIRRRVLAAQPVLHGRRSRASSLPMPLASAPTHHHKPVRAVRQRVCDEYDVHGLGRRSLEDEPELSALSVSRLVVCRGEGRLGKYALCRPGAAS